MMSERTNPTDEDELLRRMIDVDVLEPSGDEEFVLTDGFRARLDEVSERTATFDEDLRRDLGAAVEDDREVDVFARFHEVCEDLVAEYLALEETGEFSHVERLQILTVLDMLRSHPVREDGAPRSFIPVRGERIPFLTHVYDRAVVYVWLEDCPPCEAMKEQLDAVFEGTPSDCVCFSVYGPDSARTLHEQYDIKGGPTTAFFEDGEITVRLQDAYSAEAIERELEHLLDSG